MKTRGWIVVSLAVFLLMGCGCGSNGPNGPDNGSPPDWEGIVILNDNFDRANNDDLGPPWVEVGDIPSDPFSILGNQIQCFSGDLATGIWGFTFNDILRRSAQAAELEFRSVGDTSVSSKSGIAVRIDPNGTATSATMYYVEYDYVSVGVANIRLWRYVNQSLGLDGTSLGSVARVLVAGDILRIEVSGTAILVKVNGTTIISQSDALISSGRVGIASRRGNDESSATFWDNWRGGDLNSVYKSISLSEATGIPCLGGRYFQELKSWLTDGNIYDRSTRAVPLVEGNITISGVATLDESFNAVPVSGPRIHINNDFQFVAPIPTSGGNFSFQTKLRAGGNLFIAETDEGDNAVVRSNRLQYNAYNAHVFLCLYAREFLTARRRQLQSQQNTYLTDEQVILNPEFSAPFTEEVFQTESESLRDHFGAMLSTTRPPSYTRTQFITLLKEVVKAFQNSTTWESFNLVTQILAGVDADLKEYYRLPSLPMTGDRKLRSVRGNAGSDDFDRSDNTSLGSPWVERQHPAIEIIEIISNQLRLRSATAGSLGVGYAYQDLTFDADQFSELEYKASTGDEPRTGVGVRVTGATWSTGYGYFALYKDNTTIELKKIVNDSLNSGVLLASVSDTLSDGDLLRIEISGTTIQVKKNGVVIIEETDSDVSSGKPGVGVQQGSPPPEAYTTWDNWRGGDLESFTYTWGDELFNLYNRHFRLQSGQNVINPDTSEWVFVDGTVDDAEGYLVMQTSGTQPYSRIMEHTQTFQMSEILTDTSGDITGLAGLRYIQTERFPVGSSVSISSTGDVDYSHAEIVLTPEGGNTSYINLFTLFDPDASIDVTYDYEWEFYILGKVTSDSSWVTDIDFSYRLKDTGGERRGGVYRSRRFKEYAFEVYVNDNLVTQDQAMIRNLTRDLFRLLKPAHTLGYLFFLDAGSGESGGYYYEAYSSKWTFHSII